MRLHARFAVCVKGIVDEEGAVAKGLGHVAVLLVQGHADGSLAVALVQERGDVLERLLALREDPRVVVAHDVGECDLGRRAANHRGVEEALATAGVLGPLGSGHQLIELGSNRNGVHHHVLGRARMHHHATHAHQGLGGVERLVVELAQRLAVNRIAPGRAELLKVEQSRAMANLLVRNKGQFERGVQDARVLEETSRQRADLCNAGLVVRTEERRAVGAHDVLAHKAREIRHLLGRGLDDLAVNDARHKVAALVAHHVRAHAQGGGVGRGVKVRAQTERG